MRGSVLSTTQHMHWFVFSSSNPFKFKHKIFWNVNISIYWTGKHKYNVSYFTKLVL